MATSWIPNPARRRGLPLKRYAAQPCLCCGGPFVPVRYDQTACPSCLKTRRKEVRRLQFQRYQERHGYAVHGRGIREALRLVPEPAPAPAPPEEEEHAEAEDQAHDDGRLTYAEAEDLIRRWQRGQ